MAENWGTRIDMGSNADLIIDFMAVLPFIVVAASRADRGRGFHGFSGYGRRGWAVLWEAHWHRLFSWFAVRTGLAKLPEGISWAILAAGGVLAGIGFTMALFIAGRRCWLHGRGARSKAPGLKNLLRSKGVGDNALVASLLIRQSERYWARRR